jgi:hypothetical protein
MFLDGHVEKGLIVLDDGFAALPEGAKVRVEVLPQSPRTIHEQPPSLLERLKPFVGILDGLPADAALNHDQYGTPKTE